MCSRLVSTFFHSAFFYTRRFTRFFTHGFELFEHFELTLQTLVLFATFCSVSASGEDNVFYVAVEATGGTDGCAKLNPIIRPSDYEQLESANETDMGRFKPIPQRFFSFTQTSSTVTAPIIFNFLKSVHNSITV